MNIRTQGKKRRFGALILTLLGSTACIGTPSAVATPLPRMIAPVSIETPISAGGGWLIWSVPRGSEWGLEADHDGAVEPLRVAPRPQPFDVNVGTDSNGEPVATFSRCGKTPKMARVGSGEVGGSMLLPVSGAGCRLHAFNLASGHERLLPVPHPANSSDTTPSMWHGEVTFARMTPAHDISQVMLWSPHHALRILSHGEVPSHCVHGIQCRDDPVEDQVQGLDFDADVVAFIWSIQGPGIVGHEDWEVRADNIANDHVNSAGSGSLTEACIGGGLELAVPEIPIAERGGVLFSEFRRSACYQHLASSLHRYREGVAHPAFRSLPGNVLGLAREGNALYALLAPSPTFESDPGCSSAAPCELEQIAGPGTVEGS